MLLNELDLLAWQLRLRDGADAAMPRNLKRQLSKTHKVSRTKLMAIHENADTESPDAEARAASGNATPVNEAAQASEVTTLQALTFGCQRSVSMHSTPSTLLHHSSDSHR